MALRLPFASKESNPTLEASTASIAVWCVPRAGAIESELEVHVNYWRIAGDEAFRRGAKTDVLDFIEVGVLLTDARQVDQVRIYLPVEVAAPSIADCYPFFLQPGIPQGIFNEVLSVATTVPPGPRYLELLKDGTPFCRVHQFITSAVGLDQSELSIERFASGTLLTITRQAIDQDLGSALLASSYFRLRVSLSEEKRRPFVRTVPTPDRFFQSGFEEIEYIDFRLNEARTLPAQVETKMRAEQATYSVPLRLVAFLTAVPVLSGLAVSNSPFHKLRLLEHRLWNQYVPSGIPNGMMVYHWKREEAAGLKDFSAFVKLQTRRSGRSVLTRYLFIAFVFGVLGNLVASGIEKGSAALHRRYRDARLPKASPTDSIEKPNDGGRR